MFIHSVEVQGFRSFSKPQTWTCGSYGSGLYYVTGRNEVEKDLEANGAGKSSLFEAVQLGLYGKTSRGLRAGNVQCWLPRSPNCKITMDFESNGTRYKLTRSWNPNFLHLNESVVDQAELDRVIGMGPEAALHTIYFSQFGSSFVDLNPTDRLALLSDVLWLERWERASDLASAKLKSLAATVRTTELSIAQLEAKLEQLNETDWTGLEVEWQEMRRKGIADARAAIAKLDAESSFRKEAAAHRLEEYLEESLEEGKRLLHSHSAAKERIQQRVSKVKDDERHIQSKIDRVQEQLHKLAGLDGQQCPRCSQIVTAAHANKERELLSKDKTALLLQLEPIKLSQDQLKDELDDVNKLIADALEGTRADEYALAKVRKIRSRFATLYASVATSEKNLRNEILTLEKETSPYEQRMKQAQAQRDDIEAKLNTFRQSFANVQQHIKGMEYWAKGFKDVRLFIVQQVLAQLEIEVNNTLVQLGLVEWVVRFTVEQETKSGTLKRGFSILVEAPHSDGAVPFEVWSGGEAQRLRLAICMGLSNMICSYLGFSCNLEMWDEPSRGLSEAGVKEMLQVLSDRAKALGKTIWLAEHQALDYGGFAGSICLVKSESGSVIETANPAPTTAAPVLAPLARTRLAAVRSGAVRRA